MNREGNQNQRNKNRRNPDERFPRTPANPLNFPSSYFSALQEKNSSLRGFQRREFARSFNPTLHSWVYENVNRNLLRKYYNRTLEHESVLWKRSFHHFSNFDNHFGNDEDYPKPDQHGKLQKF